MSSVKIKADLEYGSVSFTVVGLVKKEDYENNDFGLAIWTSSFAHPPWSWVSTFLN